jgi:predicted TIM-barrel fold metal-dependent hydrolase
LSEPAPPFIDACVFHDWEGSRTLTPYMAEGWRDLVERAGDPAGPINFKSKPYNYSPLARKQPGALSYEQVKSGVLDSDRSERVVLGYGVEAMLTTGFHNQRMAAVAAQAANDWTVDQWLSRDQRLYGMVLVASGLPDAAAAEIRRIGGNERMVAVALGANALGRPYGHPVYNPIYEAASELDIPLVLHASVDEAFDQGVSPVAGGAAATYAERRVMASQSPMVHVTSMIIQGVFEMLPNLKVLVVGTGVSWIPAYLWRLDWLYHANAKEAPYLRRLPSEYFVEHVRVATYPLEAPPRPELLSMTLATWPGIEKLVIYASGYPEYDSETAQEILDRVREPWRPRVFRDNALEFFRWPPRPRRSGQHAEQALSATGS